MLFRSVAKQSDLMFATATAAKATDNGYVTLPFKHALTQVKFQVSTGLPNLTIELEPNGITLYNIASKGTFNLPTDVTPNPWSKLDTPANYVAPSTNVTTAGYNVPVNVVEEGGNVLMLLPQELTAWDETTNDKVAYLEVSYKLISKTSADEISYAVGSATEYGTAKIPFSSFVDGDNVWLRNNIVTYSLEFGSSDAIKFATTV